MPDEAKKPSPRHLWEIFPWLSVSPDDDSFPEIVKPNSDAEREKLRDLWDNSVANLQHEDTLFNGRFQGALVVTSFLLAALALFHGTSPYYYFFRLLIPALGIPHAYWSFKLLRGTARGIQWQMGLLIRIDTALFPEDYQPYRYRRLRWGTINRENKFLKPGLIFYQGACIPVLVISLWLGLSSVSILYLGFRVLRHVSPPYSHSQTVTPSAGQHPAGWPHTSF